MLVPFDTVGDLIHQLMDNSQTSSAFRKQVRLQRVGLDGVRSMDEPLGLLGVHGRAVICDPKGHPIGARFDFNIDAMTWFAMVRVANHIRHSFDNTQFRFIGSSIAQSKEIAYSVDSDSQERHVLQIAIDRKGQAWQWKPPSR